MIAHALPEYADIKSIGFGYTAEAHIIVRCLFGDRILKYSLRTAGSELPVGPGQFATRGVDHNDSKDGAKLSPCGQSLVGGLGFLVVVHSSFDELLPIAIENGNPGLGDLMQWIGVRQGLLKLRRSGFKAHRFARG